MTDTTRAGLGSAEFVGKMSRRGKTGSTKKPVDAGQYEQFGVFLEIFRDANSLYLYIFSLEIVSKAQIPKALCRSCSAPFH